MITIFDVLLLTGLAVFVFAVSGWLGHLVGVSPSVFALPVTVLGLRCVIGGRWWTAAVGFAVGVALAVFTTNPWPLPVLAGGGAFFLLRWLGVWLWNRHPSRRYKLLGDARLAEGQYDAALEAYTQALAVGAEDPAAVHLARGLVFAQQKDYARAFADYDQALALHPDHIGYFRRGRAGYDVGEYDRAVGDFSQAVTCSPKYAEGYLHRGLAYEAQGLYREALADYGQALTLARYLIQAHYHEAVAHEHLGEPELAVAAYERYIKMAWRGDPDLPQARERVKQLRGQ